MPIFNDILNIISSRKEGYDIMVLKKNFDKDDFNLAMNYMFFKSPNDYDATMILKYAYISSFDDEYDYHRVRCTMTEDEYHHFLNAMDMAYYLQSEGKFDASHDYIQDLYEKKEEYEEEMARKSKEKLEAKIKEMEESEAKWPPEIDEAIMTKSMSTKDIATIMGCSSGSVGRRHQILNEREKARSSKNEAISYIKRRYEIANNQGRRLLNVEANIIDELKKEWNITENDVPTKPNTCNQ